MSILAHFYLLTVTLLKLDSMVARTRVCRPLAMVAMMDGKPMSILAHFYLLTVTLLKPSDLGESFCLCGARFFKIKPAKLPGDFLQLFLTLWVGPAIVTSMMVSKPCRRTK